jgi:hypothetical protein
VQTGECDRSHSVGDGVTELGGLPLGADGASRHDKHGPDAAQDSATPTTAGRLCGRPASRPVRTPDEVARVGGGQVIDLGEVDPVLAHLRVREMA